MPDQLTANGDALRLFFTDEIYLVNEPSITWGLPKEVEVVDEAKQELPSNPKQDIQAIPVLKEFKFLGSNGRNILILVNDEENEVSDEKGRELLRKIVKSINLVSADFALVNYAKYKGSSFNELITFFKSTVVFSFGVGASALGLRAYEENVVVLEGNVKMIFSQELRRLDADLSVKKALWGVIQKLEF